MEILKNWIENERSWHIALSGEVDIYNAPQLKEALLAVLDQNEGDMIINCKDLVYIDSTGLGVLISLLKRVKEYDGSITITELKPYIGKIFTITGLDKVFNIQTQR